MALSMDEQRILAEIEQRLAKTEPALAARLASFGHPGPVNVLRSPRVRVLASCVALVVLQPPALQQNGPPSPVLKGLPSPTIATLR